MQTGTGLSDAEATRRLSIHGHNRLRPPRRRGPLMRFLAQFHNVLIYTLLASAVVTALLGHAVDTGVILGVVVINAIVGAIQEGRAENAMQAIREMLSPQATVLRDGRRRTLPAENLVPGDIVLLRSGDRVPADLRLIDTNSLQIQEAALTGESLAVDKHPDPVAAQQPLAERTSMAFAGTLVTYGAGRGVVVATGEHTEIGRISTMLKGVERVRTPLLRQIDRFARWLTAMILVVAACVFLFGIVVHDSAVADMFLAAVGIAVAAIPEGLPPVMTITLALGVTRMARRNAIIRRLPAVETLGSVSVICADKTGTITRNELTVGCVVTAENAHEFDDRGLVGHENGTAIPESLSEALRGAMLCNEADVASVNGDWTLNGNPTDVALAQAGLKAGLNARFERDNRPRTDLIPFESEHKFMASLHHDHQGRGYIYVKGAPERLLAMCDRILAGSEYKPLDRDRWREKINALACDGHRVIAIACKETTSDHANLHFDDVCNGLVLLGLFGLIDPPRPESAAAIARCRNAGIRIKMITGDHAATALSIAREVGIADQGATALNGEEIDAISDEDLITRVEDIDVFARATPQHKLRLVNALQSRRRVIAMTGDGVNDSPALKRADVGVAMGRKGTEAAKEAADMVLADDNFATIAHAVEEGRTVYDNLKKAVLFLLPTSAGEAMMIMLAVLAGSVMPVTPVQILWVNMITAVTLGIALAFEPTESDVMLRPPRPASERLMSPMVLWRTAFVGALMLIAGYGLFVFERAGGADIDTARTAAVNMVVACEAVYLLNSRKLIAASFTPAALAGGRASFIAIAVVALFQVLFTYLPQMQALFQTSGLDGGAWARIVLAALAVYVIVEIEKTVLRRLQPKSPVTHGQPANAAGA